MSDARERVETGSLQAPQLVVPASRGMWIARHAFESIGDAVSCAPHFKERFLTAVLAPAEEAIWVDRIRVEESVDSFATRYGAQRLTGLRGLVEIVAHHEALLSESGRNIFFIPDTAGSTKLLVCVQKLRERWRIYTLSAHFDENGRPAALHPGDTVFIGCEPQSYAPQ